MLWVLHMTYRGGFPNPKRPLRWEGEEEHYRSDFVIGDRVRTQGGSCGVIFAFNNTWSHIRGGRIAHITPDSAPGEGKTYGADKADGVTSWENELTPAQPGDVPSHVDRPGMGWRHVPASWEAHLYPALIGR